MMIACASRLATPFPFASTARRSRKPVCSRDSPVLLRPPRLRHARTSARPNTLAVIGPVGNIARHPPLTRHTRAVRNLKSP
jgi:hypothetical protein